MAARIRLGRARRYIYNVTNNAQDIVSVAYMPFMKWEGLVSETAEPVILLSVREKQYIEELQEIKLKAGGSAIRMDPSLTASEPQLERNEPNDSPDIENFEFNETKIKQVLNQYYALLDREELESIHQYYTEPVRKWFTSDNIAINDIISESRKYYMRFPHHKVKVDWSGLSVTELPGNKVKLIYNLDYWVKKASDHQYQFFELEITVTMNNNYRINEITERVLSNDLVNEVL